MRVIPGPRLVLSLTLCVGVLAIGLRINDVWDAASSGRLFSRQAFAETAAADAPAVSPPTLASAAPASPDKPAAAPSAAPEINIPDDASPAEMEVLKQLSNRRQELEKRAHDLDTREDLLKVAEQRVDQKIKEMETLRKQLQSMVNQATEAQAAQLDNLVKIYETMKPKEAARIFEALDMPILLSVIQRMKPARTAAVMAEMNPDKAKEITTALTKQDKLPQVK
jgi:flagellar motility protein MotE (MotC chaperone)